MPCSARYPSTQVLCDKPWAEFVPFLDYPGEIRCVIYDDLDRTHRRPVPSSDPSQRPISNEQTAMNCLYLVVRSLDPAGRGSERWINRLKLLDAFPITFEGPNLRNRQLTMPTAVYPTIQVNRIPVWNV